MSITAPIKPTPPTVSAVKLQPVESSSQSTAQPAPSSSQKPAENTAQKPIVNEKTEPPANNTTIINKVEPNDQNKIPLLNGSTGNENTEKTSAVVNTPQAVPNKASASNIDIYAFAICITLFLGVSFYFWRQRALRKPNLAKRPGKRPKPKEQGVKARTIVDYSENNTKEIIDLISSPTDINPETIKIKDKIQTKEELKGNFEFRV